MYTKWNVQFVRNVNLPHNQVRNRCKIREKYRNYSYKRENYSPAGIRTISLPSLDLNFNQPYKYLTQEFPFDERHRRRGSLFLFRLLFQFHDMTLLVGAVSLCHLAVKCPSIRDELIIADFIVQFFVFLHVDSWSTVCKVSGHSWSQQWHSNSFTCIHIFILIIIFSLLFLLYTFRIEKPESVARLVIFEWLSNTKLHTNT